MSQIINIFITSAMAMISVFGFGMILFNNERNKKIAFNIIAFIISSILGSLVFSLFDGIIKTILLCFVIILISRYVFNLNYGKTVFVAILYLILSMLSDLITLSVLIYIFDMSKEYCYTTFAGTILSNMSTSITTILLTIILLKPLKKLINYKISTNKKIILISFLTLVSLAVFFYNLISTFEFNNNIIGYLIVIVTLIMILLYLFKQKIDNDLVVKKYDELLDIMRTYEEDIEQQRTLLHETKNECATIKCKINDNENKEKIIKYIDSVTGDKVNSNMSKYSKFKYLPSNGIKGFFYYKFMEAERKGIEVSVNISKQIEKSYIGKMDTKTFKDLIRVIGVYLDNAIEASHESKDKKLGIEMYLINKNIKIIISNTYSNKIEQNKIGKENYSTKGKNRGYGLLLVNKILKDNDRFYSRSKITEELFIQETTINNKNKEFSL